jgi:hypothetical protein
LLLQFSPQMEFNKEQLRHTLSAILQAQGDIVAAELLDTARVELTYSGSDFGKNIYNLELRIPAVRFAQLEAALEKIEKKITAKLWKIGADTEDGHIGSVRIFPEPVVGSGAIAVPMPTSTDERRIWKPNHIRLFLSHVSRVKVPASDLQSALAAYGIDGFVAHKDIQPTLEWHREIEFALRSMDMLCALVTQDFTKSLWTDQEVGFALGRGVPVVAVCCGAAPYGLLGKHQALSADIAKLSSAASKIANVVSQQESFRPRFIAALVDALCHSTSFQQSKDGMKLLSGFSTQLTEMQIVSLLQALQDNSQVSDARGVPSQIRTVAEKRKISLPEKPVSTDSGSNDDIPF